MNKYIGVKMIEAKPMSLGDYNKFRGWIIPKDEDPKKEGYLVKYSDDYVSWSPKEVFEEAYLITNGYDYSWALAKLKQGRIVARKGWNGKGMYVALASKGRGKDVDVIIEPFFIIKNTHDTFNTWVPSVSDLLAEDWEDVTELYSK